MKLDMNSSTRAHFVRSLVLGLAIAPLTFAFAGVVGSVTKDTDNNPAVTKEVAQLRRELVRPCIDYRISELDSALEDKAKAEINEVFGGKVDHRATCAFILNTD